MCAVSDGTRVNRPGGRFGGAPWNPAIRHHRSPGLRGPGISDRRRRGGTARCIGNSYPVHEDSILDPCPASALECVSSTVRDRGRTPDGGMHHEALDPRKHWAVCSTPAKRSGLMTGVMSMIKKTMATSAPARTCLPGKKNRENANMKIKVMSLLTGFILAFGGAAHANCFKSVSLGEYSLGEWSDADRTWVVSGTVGSFSDVVTTRSAAETNRDTLITQCSTKGKEVIADIEKRLNKPRAGFAAEFDKSCTDSVICPMIRDITIQSRGYEIDREIGRMQAWYGASIERCKGHFNYTFNILSPRMCS